MPCPDSRTNTWKLLALPRKAIPVGIFRPEANTDAVNPGGRLMDGGRVGSKNAVLSIHCGSGVGFATVVDAADEGPGNASRGAKLHAMATEGKILNFNVILLPFPHCSRQGEHLHVLKRQIWLLSPGR